VFWKWKFQEESPQFSANRLLKNAHLLRFPHPSSLRRTAKYASLLRISGALHLGIFDQPGGKGLFSDMLILSARLKFPFHPPTQETTTLAVKECVTPDSHLSSNRSNVLRRISLNGRTAHRSLDAGGYVLRGNGFAPGAPLTGSE
jgi:hypothetical protein